MEHLDKLPFKMEHLDNLPLEIIEKIALKKDAKTFKFIYYYNDYFADFVNGELKNFYKFCKNKNEKIYFYFSIVANINYPIAIYKLLQDYRIHKIGGPHKFGRPLQISSQGYKIVQRILNDKYYRKNLSLIQNIHHVLNLFRFDFNNEDAKFDLHSMNFVFQEDNVGYLKYLDKKTKGVIYPETNETLNQIMKKQNLSYCFKFGSVQSLRYLNPKFNDLFNIFYITNNNFYMTINASFIKKILKKFIELDFILQENSSLNINHFIQFYLGKLFFMETDENCLKILKLLKKLKYERERDRILPMFIDEDNINVFNNILKNHPKSLKFILENCNKSNMGFILFHYHYKITKNDDDEYEIFINSEQLFIVSQNTLEKLYKIRKDFEEESSE